MSKKTMLALAVAGAMGALVSGGVSASTPLVTETIDSKTFVGGEYILNSDVTITNNASSKKMDASGAVTEFEANQIFHGGEINLNGNNLTLISKSGGKPENFAGVIGSNAKYPATTKIYGAGNLVIKQETKDLAVGYGSTDITADNVTIESKNSGAVYAYNGSTHKISTNGSGDVHISGITGEQAGHGVYLEEGGEVSINNFANLTISSAVGTTYAEENQDHSAVSNNGGKFTVGAAGKKTGNVTLTATNRTAFSTIGAGTSAIYADTLTVDSTIINNEGGYRKDSAIGVQGQGSLATVDVNTLTITSKNKQGEWANAIGVGSGATLKLTAGTATINGNIKSEGTFDLNGILIFNGKTAEIDTLSGDKAQITLTNKDQTLDIGRNDNIALTIAADSSVVSTISDLQKMAGVVFKEDGTVDKNIDGNKVSWFIDGSNGGYDISVDTDGNESKKISNGTLAAIRGGDLSGRLAVLGITNDVRKRLGDIRHVDAEQGAWVRYEGGRMSASGFSNKLNTLQIGYDTKALADGVRLGAAVSYTRNDADLGSGAADADMYTLSLYGTWMGDNGMYADVIARVANVKNDITIYGTSNTYTGDLNNTLYSVSGEFGQRFDIAKTFFVEPQVEVIYSYVDSDSMKLGGQNYKYDSLDSLIGRAGMVFGWNCPNDKGHVYFRASALHEFKGDSKLTTSIDSFKTDGKDTWAELGLGAQYNVNKNIHVWADVERTQGADVNEDFRGTLGVRVSF